MYAIKTTEFTCTIIIIIIYVLKLQIGIKYIENIKFFSNQIIVIIIIELIYINKTWLVPIEFTLIYIIYGYSILIISSLLMLNNTYKAWGRERAATNLPEAENGMLCIITIINVITYNYNNNA